MATLASKVEDKTLIVEDNSTSNTKSGKVEPSYWVKKDRDAERESWNAYWKIMDIETRSNPFNRLRYFGWRLIDMPVTWFREKIIEPLHDKNKWKFYHRTFARVPDIDQCTVGDQACIYQANWQFRLDKLVDQEIMTILNERMRRCIEYHYDEPSYCIEAISDFDENELNYYIKYGDLDMTADAVDCFMKQKHRMIWERRHPKIMQERAKAYEVHKEDVKKGIYDQWFYQRGTPLSFPSKVISRYRRENQENDIFSRDNVSQDPERCAEEEAKKRRGEIVHPTDEYGLFDRWP